MAPVHAQTAESAPTTTPKFDARKDAKDVKENDPSPQPQLGLKAILDQKKFARAQIVRGIFEGEYFKQAFQKIFHTRYKKVVRQHPEWFDLLKTHEHRYSPQREHGAAAINTAFEFENISNKVYGYCWGFATVVRNFHVLAFFDPNLKPPEMDHEARIRYYQDKIHDVAILRKATLFPGFANFRELSLVPELELYLKLTAMQIWRSLAIRAAGLGTMLRTRHDMNLSETRALVEDLEARLARHEMPKILINSKVRLGKHIPYSKSQHVVLVYGLRRDADGTAHLLIWDVNFYAESLQKSPKEVVIDPQGTIYYHPWHEENTKDSPLSSELALVEVTPENNAETVDHLFELKRFCADPATAGYCTP
jgi:hypothetical protein